MKLIERYFFLCMAAITIPAATLYSDRVLASPELPADIMRLENQVFAVRVLQEMNKVDAKIKKIDACAQYVKERKKTKKVMKQLNADAEAMRISQREYDRRYDEQEKIRADSKKKYKQCFADNVVQVLLKDSKNYPELMEMKLFTYDDFNKKYSSLKKPFYGKKKINTQDELDKLGRELGIKYEKYIRKLIKEVDDTAGGSGRARSEGKYIDFVHEIENLDKYTRFSFAADHEGNASLRFHTPEEQLRETVKNVLSWFIWYVAKIEPLKAKVNLTPEQEEFNKLAQQTLKRTQKLESIISKRKSKELVKSDKVDKLYKQYKELLDTREQTMNNLNYMSERYICLGLLPQEKTLAWLYHDALPNHRGLNSLERKGLMDLIRKARTLGFGILFQKDAYKRILSCS